MRTRYGTMGELVASETRMLAFEPEARSNVFKPEPCLNAPTEKAQKQRGAIVAAELFRLRTAYPTQARNFSADEVQAANALWAEIFADTDPRALHEAVTRFVAADRKGFFPSPGQIAGVIEQIAEEREAGVLPGSGAALGAGT